MLLSLRIAPVLLCVFTAACSKPAPAPGGAPPEAAGKPGAKGDPHKGHGHKPGPHTDEHADAVAVGSAELGGFQFSVSAAGPVKAGAENVFEAKVTGGASADAWKALTAYLWVESADGTQISAPVKGAAEEDGLHFHPTVQPGTVPAQLVIRLKSGSDDVRATIPLGAGAKP